MNTLHHRTFPHLVRACDGAKLLDQRWVCEIPRVRYVFCSKESSRLLSLPRNKRWSSMQWSVLLVLELMVEVTFENYGSNEPFIVENSNTRRHFFKLSWNLFVFYKVSFQFTAWLVIPWLFAFSIDLPVCNVVLDRNLNTNKTRFLIELLNEIS